MHTVLTSQARGSRALRNTALLASACGLLLMAGCASNSATPAATPAPAPVAAAPAPAPKFDMGAPSATFVFLPSVGNGDMGQSTGGSGGIGTLSFNGRRYGFTAAGVTSTQMGSAPGPMTGEVYGLKNVRDISGTYDAEMMSGGKEAVLKSKKGVTIHIMGSTALAMTLQSVTVKLN